MSNKRDRKPEPPITCSGCPATWTAPTACHCAAEGCHRTFSGVALFDAHRAAEGKHGGCIDPAAIVKKNGQPLMAFRGGMWRGPEMTDEAKARLRGEAA